MGILDKVNGEDSSENREEVTINPVVEENDSNSSGSSSRLKDEAERKLTDSSDVSLEEIHRQNERIIELLEDLTGSSSSSPSKNDDNAPGGLDGVL